MWWRMFDRAEATPDALRDDPACIEGVEADRSPRHRQTIPRANLSVRSVAGMQTGAAESTVMFTHNLEAKLTLLSLDTSAGGLELKIGKKTCGRKIRGRISAAGLVAPSRARLGHSHSGGAGRGGRAAPLAPAPCAGGRAARIVCRLPRSLRREDESADRGRHPDYRFDGRWMSGHPRAARYRQDLHRLAGHHGAAGCR